MKLGDKLLTVWALGSASWVCYTSAVVVSQDPRIEYSMNKEHLKIKLMGVIQKSDTQVDCSQNVFRILMHVGNHTILIMPGISTINSVNQVSVAAFKLAMKGAYAQQLAQNKMFMAEDEDIPVHGSSQKVKIESSRLCVEVYRRSCEGSKVDVDTFSFVGLLGLRARLVNAQWRTENEADATRSLVITIPMVKNYDLEKYYDPNYDPQVMMNRSLSSRI